jgi:hypothetical protein
MYQMETGVWQVGTCITQLFFVSLAEAVIVQTWTLHFPVAPSLNDVL